MPPTSDGSWPGRGMSWSGPRTPVAAPVIMCTGYVVMERQDVRRAGRATCDVRTCDVRDVRTCDVRDVRTCDVRDVRTCDVLGGPDVRSM